MKKTLTNFGLFLTTPLWACPTCGVAQSFTPTIIVISLLFSLIPFLIIGYIAWRVYKSHETQEAVEKKQ